MEVRVEVGPAAPAQPAREAAPERPPQPDASQRRDQHRNADPADDLPAHARNHQIAVEHVKHADEALAAARPFDRLGGLRVHEDPGPLRTAAARRGLGQRRLDAARLIREADRRQPLAGLHQSSCSRGVGRGRQGCRACRRIALRIDLLVEPVVPDQCRAGQRDGNDQDGKDDAQPFVDLEPCAAEADHRWAHDSAITNCELFAIAICRRKRPFPELRLRVPFRFGEARITHKLFK